MTLVLPLQVLRDRWGRVYIADADGDPVADCWRDEDAQVIADAVNQALGSA